MWSSGNDLVLYPQKTPVSAPTLPTLTPLQSSNDTLRLSPRLPKLRINRRDSRGGGRSSLGRRLLCAKMRVDPVRRRTGLGGRCKRAERGRRDERAVEARAEVVRLRWLVRVCRRERLRGHLRVAHVDGSRERGWRGTFTERVAIGGLARTRGCLRLVGIM